MDKHNEVIFGTMWDLFEGGMTTEQVFAILTSKHGDSEYLRRSREVIDEYNGSYDEAMGVVNIEFGYDPVLGCTGNK